MFEKYSVAFLAVLFVFGLNISTVSAQSGDDNGQSLRDRWLGDSTSDEIFDRLQKQIDEKAIEDAERKAIQDELQATMTKLRKRLFDIELFLAQLKDGVVAKSCPSTISLDNDISSLKTLMDDMRKRCAALPQDAEESLSLCQKRLTEAVSDISSLRQKRETILSSCSPQK